MFLYILEGRIHISIHFSGKDTYFGHLSGKIHSFTHFSRKDILYILTKSIHPLNILQERLHRFVYFMGKLTLIYIFYIRGEYPPSYILECWLSKHSLHSH